MASKNAVVQAYNLISANTPIIKAQNNKDLLIVLSSWQMALEDLTDTELYAAVKRFLKEVTDINRGVVVTKLLIDLAKPVEKPFDVGEIIEIANRMNKACYEEDKIKWEKLEKIKQDNPLAVEVIQRYGLSNIMSGNVSVMYSQLKKDYEIAHNRRIADDSNRRLESYKLEFADGLKLLEVA